MRCCKRKVLLLAMSLGLAALQATGCALTGSMDERPVAPGLTDAQLLPENVVEAQGAQLHRPLPPALSAEEEAWLLAAISERPDFPGAHYNGCQARAEVLARLAYAAVGERVFKVWLLSSSRVTPMSEGAIRYRDARWDYHVALGWVGPDGVVRVMDDVVSEQALPLDTWLAAFEVDGFAVMLRTHPSVYGLVLSPLMGTRRDSGQRIPRDLFNGEAWAYDGCTAAFHDGALEMALNAASEALRENPESCAPWQPLVQASVSLRGVLAEPVGEGECTGFSVQPRDPELIPPECVDVYRAALDTWRKWIVWGL